MTTAAVYPAAAAVATVTVTVSWTLRAVRPARTAVTRAARRTITAVGTAAAAIPNRALKTIP